MASISSYVFLCHNMIYLSYFVKEISKRQQEFTGKTQVL